MKAFSYACPFNLKNPALSVTLCTLWLDCHCCPVFRDRAGLVGKGERKEESVCMACLQYWGPGKAFAILH